MGKINLLSSKVFNRIAAGEVVERPSSVVKELVENSIDAGAKSIEVWIENGGISSIKVIDDGCGIAKEDLPLSLMPHATSKISSVKDLDAISTLGFRGEALPSISSVSKITIRSKTKNQTAGAEINAEGENIEGVKDAAAIDGTEITVRNLFFNTPVRAKFLKSEKSEENEIASCMARFILGNPDICFKFVANGSVSMQSFGDGLESAFVSVYGINTLNNCFYIDTIKNGIRISGYLGKHNFTKPNRSHQTVVLNGRYVLNQTVASAINNAYSSYLMKRQYPFYFIKIDMPTDAVDVNVHPNKIDVRFINNQIVYGALYSVVSKVLDGSQEALNIVVEDKNTQVPNNQQRTNDFNNKYVTHSNVLFDSDKLFLSDSEVNKEEQKNDIKSPNYNGIKEEQKNADVDIFEENKKFLLELERKKAEETLIESNTVKEQTCIKIDKELKLIGQTLNTYLILEDGENVYFIDQHAAHERILFDKIVYAYNQKNVVKQPLLVPYVLNLNSVESEFLEAKISFFNDMGFDIDEFGVNTYRINSIPAYLTDLDVKKFFDGVLFDVDILKKLTVKDVLFEKIAQKACKSAIKSGDKLSEKEIEELLKLLKNDLGLKCPHGRPVAVKITRTEIDKWFKRII